MTSNSIRALRRITAALAFTPLVACSGAVDNSQAGEDAVTGALTPWTAEADVRDTAHYDSTVLAYFRQHAERGTFLSDHRKVHDTKQGADVSIAYAIVRAQKERGAVVVVNGRTESFSHYGELAYDLSRRGYTLYFLDHRGQGHSSRLLEYDTVGDSEYQKGYVDNFQDYVDDLGKFVQTVVLPDRVGKAPGLFAIAHSMGGAITTMYAEQFPKTFDAIVLSSPMHEIKINQLEIEAAKLGNLLHPTVYAITKGPQKDNEPFAGNDLTSSEPRFDAKMAVFHGDPETKVGGPTYHWITESMNADAALQADAGKVTAPVLLMEAAADQIVAPGGQHTVCNGINAAGGKCTLEVLPNSQHEILVEVDPIRFHALDLAFDFIEKHRPAGAVRNAS